MDIVLDRRPQRPFHIQHFFIGAFSQAGAFVTTSKRERMQVKNG